MDGLIDTLTNYGTVAIGLGFVIFIHELGHFLLAKWNGVKVEAFAIGFGRPLISYRKGIGFRLLGSTAKAYEQALADPRPDAEPPGETEYSVRMIPLGGFVKMLGEGDEANTHTEPTSDPRAYSNKSVGARMQIISAGVIMNLICGMVFFAIAYGRGGLRVPPAKIQFVMPGSPAYNAGIRSGDEVVAVNGRGDVDFITLQRVTALSAPGEALDLTIKRPGSSKPLDIEVVPRRDSGSDTKKMGIAPALDVELAEPPFAAPAGLAAEPKFDLKREDRVVAAGPEGAEPTPVADTFAFARIASRHRDVPLKVVVERDGLKGSKRRATAVLPVIPYVDFGLRLTPGPIKAVQPDSPAAKAGLRVGDRIVAVDGSADFDPMRLPQLFASRAGTDVSVKVERVEEGRTKTEDVVLKPDDTPLDIVPGYGGDTIEVPGLGLSLEVVPHVAAVAPGSPAAKAKIVPGDEIYSVTITSRREGKRPITKTVVLDGERAGWVEVFDAVQGIRDAEVTLHLLHGGHKAGPPAATHDVRVQPVPDPTWPSPRRGLQFVTLSRPLPPMGPAASVSRGLADTQEAIVSIFKMIRGLITGEVGANNFGGMFRIADMASHAARDGMHTFLLFLGMLNINLAVINFLPIPPLDGGQMAFLVAEKLRGRPLPERAQNAGMLTGLVFVLGLMLFVLYQDIVWYFFST